MSTEPRNPRYFPAAEALRKLTKELYGDKVNENKEVTND